MTAPVIVTTDPPEEEVAEAVGDVAEAVADAVSEGIVGATEALADVVGDVVDVAADAAETVTTDSGLEERVALLEWHAAVADQSTYATHEEVLAAIAIAADVAETVAETVAEEEVVPDEPAELTIVEPDIPEDEPRKGGFWRRMW